MIVRTLERAALAGCFESIVCATDSEEIARVVTAAGLRAVMTGPAATGSDRVAEAARILNLFVLFVVFIDGFDFSVFAIKAFRNI